MHDFFPQQIPEADWISSNQNDLLHSMSCGHWATCDGCELSKQRRSNTSLARISGYGPAFLFIGTRPGIAEQRLERPWVSEARIWERMIDGLPPITIYWTNLVGCRGPLSPEVINSCHFHLDFLSRKVRGAVYMGKDLDINRINCPSISVQDPASIARQEYKIISIQNAQQKIKDFICPLLT